MTTFTSEDREAVYAALLKEREENIEPIPFVGLVNLTDQPTIQSSGCNNEPALINPCDQ